MTPRKSITTNKIVKYKFDFVIRELHKIGCAVGGFDAFIGGVSKQNENPTFL